MWLSTLKMEAIGSSKSSRTPYETTQRHNAEDCISVFRSHQLHGYFRFFSLQEIGDFLNAAWRYIFMWGGSAYSNFARQGSVLSSRKVSKESGSRGPQSQCPTCGTAREFVTARACPWTFNSWPTPRREAIEAAWTSRKVSDDWRLDLGLSWLSL